ncbi:hypothetical protein predicted by Glimmer/Critica [Acetobacter ghanensis]|uniref:Uncharacterized protein n=1 Tax=Acetobacter ghanensis TaxID=431306 RepID=A0A0U5F180_9PROT|nr:hypothetical protein predicted by Glimmer/Critica [Acetobacter ghanensis]
MESKNSVRLSDKDTTRNMRLCSKGRNGFVVFAGQMDGACAQ